MCNRPTMANTYNKPEIAGRFHASYHNHVLPRLDDQMTRLGNLLSKVMHYWLGHFNEVSIGGSLHSKQEKPIR